MTARIEIGRLAAKDLGKFVSLGGEPRELRGVIQDEDGTGLLIGKRWYNLLPSDTLIEVTGTNNKEQA